MKLLFLGAALVLLLIIIYFFFFKKNKKILLEEVQTENLAENISAKPKQFYNKFDQERAHHEAGEVVEDLKSSGVRPEGNQQRNLDRELGGLEAEEYKETGEKDVWDDRSDEIDKIGAIDQLGSAAKKSMIWRKKKEKLDEKRHSKSADAAQAHHESRSGAGFDSRASQGGLGQMIKARNDFSHERGGGMSR